MGAGREQNPEGSSFRKGALYPAKSFCGPCGRKRFPASLQESKESPWRWARCKGALDAYTGRREASECVAAVSRDLEDARAGNVAPIASRERGSALPDTRGYRRLISRMSCRSVLTAAASTSPRRSELLGQALHLLVKPLVDGAASSYPRQLPKQLQHVLAQGAVHPDVRHHGNRLVVKPRHDEVLLAHATLRRHAVEPELLLRRHPEGNCDAPPSAVVRKRHQMPALVASRARAISPCLSGKRCA